MTAIQACRECKKVIIATARVCPHCGAEQDHPDNRRDRAPEPWTSERCKAERGLMVPVRWLSDGTETTGRCSETENPRIARITTDKGQFEAAWETIAHVMQYGRRVLA